MAKFCSNCGHPIDIGDTFCDNCGARLNAAPSPAETEGFRPPPVNFSQQTPPTQPTPNSRTAGRSAKSVVIPIVSVAAVAAVAAVGVFIVPKVIRSRKNIPPETNESVSAENEENDETMQILPDDEPNPYIADSSEAKQTAVTTTAPPETTVETTTTTTSAATTTTTTTTTTTATEPPADENIPDIEKYGFVENLSIGALYDFPTVCSEDKSLETVGTILILKYEREDVDADMIAFGRENGMSLENYERLTVSASLVFDDDNAQSHAVEFETVYFDVTDARRFHNTYTKQTDSYGETYGRAEIEYNGGTAYIYRYDDVMTDWSRGEPVYVIEDWTFLVPKGYTGLMIGYRSGAVEKGGDEYAKYSPEDYHLLRLDYKY